MDPFAVIIFGGLAGIIVACLLLGRYYPGNGQDILDWHPTRSPEVEAQNEVDDIEQMLEAANRRRRLRGAPELTEESMRLSVAADVKATHERADQSATARAAAAEEVTQMLDIKNRRRARKGLPPITEAAFRAEIEEQA